MAIEKAPKHGGRETLAAIGDQAFLDFQQRHVRPAANETEQIVAMGLYTTGTTIKHAALKLMRKLLRKYAVVPDRLVTDDLRSYRQRPSISASTAGMSAGDGRTIGPRIRISRPAGGSVRCNASRARAQPRSFSQPTPPPTTLSTSNDISRQLNLTACSATRR
jgi:hypothetical protein